MFALILYTFDPVGFLIVLNSLHPQISVKPGSKAKIMFCGLEKPAFCSGPPHCFETVKKNSLHWQNAVVRTSHNSSQPNEQRTFSSLGTRHKNHSAAPNWYRGVTDLAVIAAYWPACLAQAGPPSLCQRVEKNRKTLNCGPKLIKITDCSYLAQDE